MSDGSYRVIESLRAEVAELKRRLEGYGSDLPTSVTGQDGVARAVRVLPHSIEVHGPDGAVYFWPNSQGQWVAGVNPPA